MNYFWRETLTTLLVIIITLTIIFGIFVGANQIIKVSCEKEATIMGLEWDYNIWIPCMVKQDDRWVNLDNYRYQLEELQ